MTYTIGIEADGDDHRVVIRRPDKSLLGVPFRSRRREEAERMLTPLRYAYEYGLRAMREQAARLPDRVTQIAP